MANELLEDVDPGALRLQQAMDEVERLLGVCVQVSDDGVSVPDDEVLVPDLSLDA